MNRRERKKEETKNNIIRCSVSYFREKGFEETSMEEIAVGADVSKGTLYNYFSDKESILVAYFQLYIKKSGSDLKASIKEVNGIDAKLYCLMDFAHQVLSENRDFAAFYVKFRLQSFLDSDSFDNSNRSGLEDIVHEILNEAQIHNKIRNDIPTVILARNFQFLIRSYLISCIYSSGTEDMNVLKEQLVGLFLNGAKQYS